MQRTAAALFALVALVVPLTACGGDDDGGGGSVQAYCDLSNAGDGREDFPSDDELDEIADAAPDEIDDDIELVVDRIKEANDDPESAEEVFDDPEVTEALENIEAFETENCDAAEAEE